MEGWIVFGATLVPLWLLSLWVAVDWAWRRGRRDFHRTLVELDLLKSDATAEDPDHG